ncbi:hypothetical protein LTR36_002958 [Oleoguttula mirabilis]|uniref:Dipeptidyl-peptidase V n=1 Tax=Oleoguttula mirabilis TaxID=1507867 RepID=A0AAV9JW90_9PEZI|nr:hypothetical protein LTR36_002958 [Oleoguttula mirabilis]
MKFTPDVLLSAPRRSAGVPNAAGSLILYTESTYSFQTHKKSIELRVLEVDTGDSHELAKNDEISDLNWLDDDQFACLQAEKDGTTSLYVASISNCLQKSEVGSSHYVAGAIEAAAGSLKLAKLDAEGYEYAVIVSAPACPDGTLYTPDKAARKTQSSGQLYTNLMVRHWDHYVGTSRNSLWYGKLSKSKSEGGKYKLSLLTNALKGTALECTIQPFGGTEHFDISQNGIIFVAKDPELNPALNTKCNVYLLQLQDWLQKEASAPRQIIVPGFEGACTSPVFNSAGDKVAFLMMAKNGYEADRNVMFIASVSGGRSELEAQTVLQDHKGDLVQEGYHGLWDRSPQAISFSADGEFLLATAEELGHGRLFDIRLHPSAPLGREIRQLTDRGYVSSAIPLRDGRVFVSGSSLVDNSWYAIVDARSATSPSPDALTTWSHSNSTEGSKFGLRKKQVSSIWTPASNPAVNKEVHSIVVKPSSFDPKSSRTYPVAYLIHGGPQGSWGDSWSTRWNPAVYAEQGYIVIAPNPTGSTGYGQEFCDSIRDNWGGDPYQDIVNLFDWVGKNMPEADNERAVALGASYGGYMMNWIQGHDLGRKFKALVCHDGIFSFAGGMLATDELYFPFHDLGGTPWYDPGFKQTVQAKSTFDSSTLSDWRRWDPSEHLANWSTPQLVIHSSKDYRLAISEGLAAFNVLQARGIESQFLCFPDENHFVLKPENSLAWHKTVLNWINKHVGLPTYTDEGPESEEFWGGVRSEKDEVAEMPTQGKPET